jgi:hypothetical protein
MVMRVVGVRAGRGVIVVQTNLPAVPSAIENVLDAAPFV